MADNRFVKVDGSFERPAYGGSSVVDYLSSTGKPSDFSSRRVLANDLGITDYSGSEEQNLRLLGSLRGDSPTFTPSPDSGSSADLPGAPAAPAASGDPMDNFNLLLTGMLKGAQGVNTADYLKKKRELERASLGETSNMTDEDLRTLSPSQQAAIRSGKTSALRPEIDANAYELEKAQQNIDNFFRVHSEAQKLGQEFADKMVAPESVILNARKIIETNPDSLSTVLAGFNDKSKQKILEGIDYGKMKSTDSTDPKTSIVDVNGRKFVVDDATGNIINEVAPTTSISQTPEQQQKKEEVLALINELRADDATGKGSAVGSSAAKLLPFGQSLGLQGNRTAFEARLNTLKSNLTLDNLKLLKGAMSDKDLAFLQAVASSLDVNMSEEAFNSELDRLKTTLEAAPAAPETKEVNGVQYQKVDGGWQKVSFNSGEAGTNRPQRNNNPLNIKASSYTQSFPGVAGLDPSPASDGGNFLVFDSPQSGLAAAERLITSGSYTNLSVDAALRRWSGGGYGAEIVPGLKNKTIGSLTQSELSSLIQTMARREGFYA